ncbi:BtrH N-terminal domain-containing protein [Robertmurraya siralis]|uniref:BtrH N-terminal domain-containing protein n=1 Tax=Robertmurraya siralis TaxID=77777 RepID=UPI000BA7AFB2|nr:BtrH N-terminal domain-containing protein [Robertmurraya siralis]PAE18250.1 hypothetical protein CHH80_22665 [Bacillus sp. 7504-2]
MERGLHCTYYVISKYLMHYDIKLKEEHLFHLIGGYELSFKNLDNRINFRGNNFNLGLLKELNLEFKIKNFDIFNLFIDYAKQRLEFEPFLMLFTDSFYLPYDKTNYHRNSGSHLIMLELIDEKKGIAVVSDFRYQNRIISLQELETASINCSLGKGVNLLDIEIHKKMTEIEYISFVKKAILDNLITYDDTKCDYLTNNFKIAFLDFVSSLTDPLIYKLELEAAAKSIHHPNGPISTRKLMLRSLNNSGLDDDYVYLSLQWFKLSKTFLKHSKFKNEDFEDLFKAYSQLIKNEFNVINKVKKYLIKEVP